MDMFGDAANIAILPTVLIASWKFWNTLLDLHQKIGGLSVVLRTGEGWKNVRLCGLHDVAGRHPSRRALKGLQNWPLAWIVLIMAVSFTLIAIAGLRWIWIRLRDIVAGA